MDFPHLFVYLLGISQERTRAFSCGVPLAGRTGCLMSPNTTKNGTTSPLAAAGTKGPVVKTKVRPWELGDLFAVFLWVVAIGCVQDLYFSDDSFFKRLKGGKFEGWINCLDCWKKGWRSTWALEFLCVAAEMVPENTENERRTNQDAEWLKKQPWSNS